MHHHSKKGYLGCFLVEDDSFIEIRDCFIKSIKDPKVIEKEKDNFVSDNV